MRVVELLERSVEEEVVRGKEKIVEVCRRGK